MIKISKAVQDALHATTGTRRIKFRYELYRGAAYLRNIRAEGSVALSRFNSIERTARLTVWDNAIDWLKDTIKPVMSVFLGDPKQVTISTCSEFDSLQLSAQAFDDMHISCADFDAGLFLLNARPWQDFNLGVFVPSTPVKQVDGNGVVSYDVTAYDKTVILREDCITDRLYIAAGTKYLDAVQSLLVSAGVDNVIIADPSTRALITDREFEIGTSKLEIINKLLDEINYNKIRCNADGYMVISAYKRPSEQLAGYTYDAGNSSVLHQDMSTELDMYNLPNVFVGVISNPEIEPLSSRYVNDSPASKLSTINRGRQIVKMIEVPDYIVSQADLDDYVSKYAFESNQIYEQVTVATALMPIHESAEVLNLNHPELSGIYIESNWQMDLTAGGRMTHTARRLVMV